IPGNQGMAVGIATLLLAALSPLLLLQGIRIGESGTSNVVRGWGAAGIGAITNVGWVRMASSSIGRSVQAKAVRLRERRTGSSGA
ncbi:MAG TPA: hypothetical protein VNV65_11030, partial [Candidatus Solibacter sp.]|nr:hypothetical protein [Candidatus Solibacter sp.]